MMDSTHALTSSLDGALRVVRVTLLMAFTLLMIGSLAARPCMAQVVQGDGQTDPYALPDTEDILELQIHIGRLSALQPRDLQEYEAHLIKLPIAVQAVANRIMELDPDPTSPAHAQAEFLTVVAAVLGVRQATHDERAALVERIAGRLTNHPRLADDAGVAEQLAESLETMGEEELARTAYQTFGAKLSESTTPDIATLGKRMLGTIRRKDLIGSDFEFKGQLIDGSELNQESLAGKVVLVDFWATWCGPCVREVPRIKDLYSLYQEDGFEVVGVNLDADRIRAEEFIENEVVPWPNLFQDGTGWDHPLAVYYGIKALPTTVLLDRQGKVVAMDVRSEELAEKLPELLGIARKVAAPAGSNSESTESDR